MGQPLGGQLSPDALRRSEVRRWRVPQLELVHHRRVGQEWIPHWHAEWSIGAIINGDCQCSIGGRPVHGKAGDLVAVAPETVHTGALISEKTADAVSVVMLYVAPEWFASARLPPPAGSGFIPAPDLAAAAGHLQSGAQVQAWLHHAIEFLGKAWSGQAQGPNPSDAVREVLLAFEQGVLAGESSVARLAERCHISRERLHRVIQQWAGMSPSHYLRAYRVNKARAMLLGGETLATVAFACGFSDQAHFTRLFRRSFGYTPGDLAASVAKQSG